MTAAMPSASSSNGQVRAEVTPDRGSGLIIESRSRCERNGLNPGHILFKRVSDAELAQRIQRNRRLLDTAVAHLKWVAAATVGLPYVVYLTDQDGIVLHSIFSDAEVARLGGIEPGLDRSEETIGTNGAGTAIAANRPVAVIRHEHYAHLLRGWTSAAAPIRGKGGSIVGAIDAATSSHADNGERIVLVAYTAHEIELELANGQIGGIRKEDPVRIAEVSTERLRLHALRDAALRNRERALAMAAHEIRNPLNLLGLLLHSLFDSARQEDERDVVSSSSRLRTLQKALATTHKIARLINDFADITLSSAGKLQLQRSDADLMAIIRESDRP
jgi:transcriptional regulator of acetoin/glycerol metabolism